MVINLINLPQRCVLGTLVAFTGRLHPPALRAVGRRPADHAAVMCVCSAGIRLARVILAW